MPEFIFLKLLLAHIIGDFFLQPSKWVKDKKTTSYKSKYLYAHTAIHAILAYLIVGEWSWWYLPLLVFVIHSVIDIWKSVQQATTFYFLLDQFFHLVSILVLTMLFTNETGVIASLFSTPSTWIIIIAYLLVLRPYAFIVALFTEQWRNEIRDIEEKDKIGSLDNAGKYIGMFERVLVLTFILSGNPGGIGMLIAAKSVLRFNDLKGESSRKMSEYVLIGTLVSFSLCILTGLLALYAIDKW